MAPGIQQPSKVTHVSQDCESETGEATGDVHGTPELDSRMCMVQMDARGAAEEHDAVHMDPSHREARDVGWGTQSLTRGSEEAATLSERTQSLIELLKLRGLAPPSPSTPPISEVHGEKNEQGPGGSRGAEAGDDMEEAAPEAVMDEGEVAGGAVTNDAELVPLTENERRELLVRYGKSERSRSGRGT